MSDPKHWVHAGEIENLAKEAGYLGSTATRALRTLEHKDGKIWGKKRGKSKVYQYCPQFTELCDQLAVE